MRVFGSVAFAVAAAIGFATMALVARNAGEPANTYGFAGAAAFFLACGIAVVATSRGIGASRDTSRQAGIADRLPEAIDGDIIVAASPNYSEVRSWAVMLDAEEIAYRISGENSGVSLSFLAGEQQIQLIVDARDAAEALAILCRETLSE